MVGATILSDWTAYTNRISLCNIQNPIKTNVIIKTNWKQRGVRGMSIVQFFDPNRWTPLLLRTVLSFLEAFGAFPPLKCLQVWDFTLSLISPALSVREPFSQEVLNNYKTKTFKAPEKHVSELKIVSSQPKNIDFCWSEWKIDKTTEVLFFSQFQVQRCLWDSSTNPVGTDKPLKEWQHRPPMDKQGQDTSVPDCTEI